MWKVNCLQEMVKEFDFNVSTKKEVHITKLFGDKKVENSKNI